MAHRLGDRLTGYRLAFWIGVAGMGAVVATGLARELASGRLPSLEQDPLARARQLAAGDRQALLAEYRDFAALQPRDAQAYMKLGTTLARHGDEPGAIEAFEAAVALHPVPAGAHSKLATLYFNQGRVQEAREQARLAVARGALINDRLLRRLGVARPRD